MLFAAVHGKCDLTMYTSQAYSRSVRYSDATFIVSACECYGRFVIHKEAASGGELAFSAGIQRLLDWTTVKVPPSLLDRKSVV